jgi:hypothetical protein
VVREYEAPQGEVETTLAQIWAQLLKVERVGRHDNFFELGGHSLLAVQVTSRVRQHLGVEVAIKELFVRPVLSDFGRSVGCAAQSVLPRVTRAEADEREALSFAQQRLWFLAQMGQAVSTAYHISISLQLSGALDFEALRRALNRLMIRHEALRTSFPQEDGNPRQRIVSEEESEFALQEHDLREHADAVEALERIIVEEEREPFDLECGPLIRGRLIRQSVTEHVLLITMHHIVSDGWSMGIIVNELSALYRAYRSGKEDPLPVPELQYADYAAWQRRWMAGEILQQQADYWKATLGGAPALLELPTDRPRPAEQDYTGSFIEYELDAELTRIKPASWYNAVHDFAGKLGGGAESVIGATRYSDWHT